MGEAAKVFVVDDDPAVARALGRLLRASGYQVQDFASPAEFLHRHDPLVPGCLVLDLALPGLSGLELQDALAAADCIRPIVFISGRGDIPSSVRAIRGGAVDFLTKPVNPRQLLVAVQCALAQDAHARTARHQLEALKRRLDGLTPREREVLTHVVAGRLNKQIAADLGIVEKTVKVHRARVMEKMAAASLASLVRIADRLGVTGRAP